MSSRGIWLQSEVTSPRSTCWEPGQVPGQLQFQPLVSWTGLILLGCWALPKPHVPQEQRGCQAQASGDQWAVSPAGPLLPAPSNPVACRSHRKTPRITQVVCDALQALRGLCPGLSTHALLVWDLWRVRPKVQAVSSLLCLLFSSPLAWTTSLLFSFSLLMTPSLRASLRFLSVSALSSAGTLPVPPAGGLREHTQRSLRTAVQPREVAQPLRAIHLLICDMWTRLRPVSWGCWEMRDLAPEAGRNDSRCVVASWSPLCRSPEAVDAPWGRCPLQRRDGGDHISHPSSGLCRPMGPRFSVFIWLHNCVWRKCTRDGFLQSWKLR